MSGELLQAVFLPSGILGEEGVACVWLDLHNLEHLFDWFVGFFGPGVSHYLSLKTLYRSVLVGDQGCWRDALHLLVVTEFDVGVEAHRPQGLYPTANAFCWHHRPQSVISSVLHSASLLNDVFDCVLEQLFLSNQFHFDDGFDQHTVLVDHLQEKFGSSLGDYWFWVLEGFVSSISDVDL